jgi:hypothetical protein
LYINPVVPSSPVLVTMLMLAGGQSGTSARRFKVQSGGFVGVSAWFGIAHCAGSS